ncbi:WD40 repeat protein [Kribbella antiqua]|uniref:WD40 repeat protein n=1 Tax=Kribbella antiqua TaxID=2512217 RepID=A0A4R2IYI9_9ACTN|nr:choice-of-anchor D domain-containing protein [Kribbella antiqua]TCO50584.1 WD40 repeat protein [Kribbella antiqua]
MSRIPRVPTAIIAAASLLTAGLAVLSTSRDAAAAQEEPSLDIVSRAAGDPSYRSAISANGQWVVYETGTENTRSSLSLRDLTSGTDTTVPDDGHSAAAPSISGDAGLIAFIGDRETSRLNHAQDQQIFTVNRRDPEHPVVKPVTNTPNDLPYQRMPRCTIAIADGDDGDGDCVPQLSRDGRTLVAQVEQSVAPNSLELTIAGHPAEVDYHFYPVLDFGAFSTSAESSVTVKNTGTLPVVYPDTGPVIEGDSAFTITSSTCAATLQPGATCAVQLKFIASSACGDEMDAVLRFPATSSAAGQTAVKLTGGGECPRVNLFTPQAQAAEDCTGPSQYPWQLPTATQPKPAEEGRPQPRFDIGITRADELRMVALTIQNTMSSPQTPRLTSPGCQLKLVLPEAAPANACRPGQPMAPQSTCTAYVEYRIPDVAPFSGGIHLGDTVYRIGGYSARNVVAAWRDPGAAGNFGPARIVSVTGTGNVVMDGSGPTVSADGRWVGYVSDTTLGRPDASPDKTPEQSQVYLHDTDAGGDGTYKPGPTTLVSLLPDDSIPDRADEPSVSDDGTRIAFTGASDQGLQVYVRNLPGPRTILASSGPDGTAGNEYSETPQLSGDGYTIAYQSAATNLGVGTLPAARIIARDLTKDLSNGRSSNELISVRPPGSGSSGWDRFPAITPDGTQLTFASRDVLDTSGDADSDSDVYHAQRKSSLTVGPNPLDFGTAAVGTTSGAKAVIVTNDGLSLLRLDEPFLPSTDFAIDGDQCTGKPLRPGQSCAYLVKFTPKAVGARTATLFVRPDDAGSTWLEDSLTGRGTSDSRIVGTTSHVSTNTGVHQDPSISDNGQFVAYRTGAGGDGSPDTINVRNQANNDIRQFGRHGEVGQPSISGDGTRVAYNAQDGLTKRTVVADGSGTHQISGTTTDLRYQRPCGYVFFSRQCQPSLAGDGKTVAFPARLDPRSDALKLTLTEADNSTHEIGTLIDLGAGGERSLKVDTDRAISFAGPPTVDPGSGFDVVRSTCQGDLAANASCTINLKYSACAGKGLGMLRLNGATPEGQMAVALVANGSCVKLRSLPTTKTVTKAAADCTPIPASGPVWPSSDRTNAGLPLADAGDRPIGQVRYVAIAVEPQSSTQEIGFESGSCDLALVGAENPDPNLPKPCVQGKIVPANTGCTAYVGFRPSTAEPSAAFLTAYGPNKQYRFAGAGYQDVVLTRADTGGDGTFAGAPEIASKDSSGATLTGIQPSLSADGRYVAFESSAIIDRPAADTTQVYRRDRTDGKTILVSQLPDGKIDELGTYAPSLSASGDRVAFVTEGESDEGEGASVFGRPSQVWARDIPSGKTVLVSAAAGKPTVGGDDWSYTPSMSDDGSTVGFASEASDLVTEPGNGRTAVYVRYLEPDFANAGQRFSERVSLSAEGAVPEGGYSGDPSLSADGAFTAFESSSQLVATDTDESYDVYVRRRPAQLVVEPATVDFGAVKIGKSSSLRQLVVRNVGNGPAAAGPTSVAAPFVAGSNVCKVTLHRGESCPADARFAPTAAGRVNGLLTLPSVQGYLAGPSVSAGLSGAGTTATPVAGLSVVPGKLVFPAQKLGTSAASKVTLRNTGDVALEVTASVIGEDFGISLGSCAMVMPATSCDVPVTFAPRKTGTRSGSVVFRAVSGDPAVKSPPAVTVGLSGVGSPGPTVASMTVAPKALVFGPQILLSPSAPKSIVVTNTGNVPLAVTGVPSVADFTSTPSCASVLPGKTCEIAVRFMPSALGKRSGVVQVSATASGAVAPFSVPVDVSGTTLTPALTVEPPVVRPGQVVLASGINFPPSRSVVLNWKDGLGSQQAVTDKSGRFKVAILVFRRDLLGQRALTGTIPGLALPVVSPPVLVMPLRSQPPDFVLRW